MRFNEEQSSNALSPICLMLSGKTMKHKAVQPLNAHPSISVMLLERVINCKEEQSSKELHLIVVIPSGRVTEVRDAHL